MPRVRAVCGVCAAIGALALAVPTLPSSVGEPILPGNAGEAAGTPYVRSGVGGRRRLLAACGANEHLTGCPTACACTPCPDGYTRDAVDNTDDGANTECTTCAANYRVDNTNTCVACATGSVNDAGDDASAELETHCTCPVNYRVESSECVACAGGSTRAAGDNPLVDGDTDCGCATDERVVDNTCTACPAGTTNAAGDDPLGVDTVCEPVAYVELLVVNDKARCDAFGVYRQAGGSGDYGPTELAEMHAHTAAVVASVGTIFASARGFSTKTRVVLVGQVDWCDGDQLDATYFIPATHEGIVRDGYPTAETDADALLSAFGIWRDANLDAIAKNDVAHLFTGRDLTANSVGGAYQYSACSDDSSYCGATNPRTRRKR